MSALDEDILNLQACGLSTGSIAGMVGKSADWVAARLDRLLAPAEPKPEPEVAVREEPKPAPLRIPVELDEPMVTPPAPRARRMEPQVQARPVAPRPQAGRSVGEVTLLTPLTPRKLHYVKRFLGAGWRLPQVAKLFDLEPEQISEAIAA